MVQKKECNVTNVTRIENLVKVCKITISINVCMFVIVITIIFLVTTFMQGIYSYIAETKNISTSYSVAAVLYLQFVLRVMLFRP